MTPLSKRTLEWMLKVKSSYKFWTKASCKLRNGTKTFLELKFFLFILKFKKLGFSALNVFKQLYFQRNSFLIPEKTFRNQRRHQTLTTFLNISRSKLPNFFEVKKKTYFFYTLFKYSLRLPFKRFNRLFH